MKELVPLIQTVLWVGLISAVLYRYHDLIEALITSVKTRIDSGGSLRVGPVELAAIAKPQDPEQQAKNSMKRWHKSLKPMQRSIRGKLKYKPLEKASDLCIYELRI
jgi:hypothetical protein